MNEEAAVPKPDTPRKGEDMRAREAAALRENLARRKAQRRGREKPGAPDGASDGD